MTHLVSLPKPDGFDLRNARAGKADDGTKWLPEDAMFDASRAMVEAPPEGALVVAWYSRNENGKFVLKYRCFHQYDRQSVALAADLLSDLSA